jgi:hypothetical protein
VFVGGHRALPPGVDVSLARQPDEVVAQGITQQFGPGRGAFLAGDAPLDRSYPMGR